MVDIMVNVRGSISDLQSKLATAKSTIASFTKSSRAISVASSMEAIQIPDIPNLGEGFNLGGISRGIEEFIVMLEYVKNSMQQIIPISNNVSKSIEEMGNNAKYVESEFNIITNVAKNLNEELKKKSEIGKIQTPDTNKELIIGGIPQWIEELVDILQHVKDSMQQIIPVSNDLSNSIEMVGSNTETTRGLIELLTYVKDSMQQIIPTSNNISNVMQEMGNSGVLAVGGTAQWIKELVGILLAAKDSMQQIVPVSNNVANSIQTVASNAKILEGEFTVLSGETNAATGVINAATGVIANFDKELKKKPADVSNFIKSLQWLQDSFGKLGSKLGRSGKMLAWFGFRLTMIGRMFSRQLTKTISKTVGIFKNWDKTIQSIGVGLGFLAASGNLSGDAQNMMIDAMKDAPMVGMQLEGVMAALSALFVNIGADVLPKLASAFLDLIVVLNDVWSENSEKFKPIIDKIADETIPKLIDVIKSVGPEAIEGFLNGLNSGIKAITGIIDNFDIWMPKIGETTGYLIAMSPVLTALGLGFFGLSVIMQTISIIFGAISGTIGLLTTTVQASGQAAGVMATVLNGPLILALGAVALLVATIILWWEELTDAWNMLVAPAIEALQKAFGHLYNSLGINIDWMDALKRATAPVAVALELIMAVVGFLITAFAFLIDKIADLIDWLKTITDPLAAAQDAIAGISKSIKGVLGIKDTKLDILAQTINDQGGMSKSTFDDWTSRQPSTSYIDQEIPIDISINVENMSSDADIDYLVDQVSRGIADQLEANHK